MDLIEPVKNILSSNKECYKDVADVIFQNLEDDKDKIEKLEEISRILERTARSEKFLEDAFQALRPILTETNNNNEDEEGLDSERYKEEYEAVKKRFNDPKTAKRIVKNDPDVLYVKNIIKELKGPANSESQTCNDEEITATQETINLIDPFTKVMMENPVRNTRCGHVYDKDSTLTLIKLKKRKGIRCPYMGCQNKTPLIAEHLVDALDFRREIVRRKQSEL